MARSCFQGRNVNITTHGRPYLGSSIGSHEFTVEYVSNKVTQWCEELLLLTKIAVTQPHADYSAFTHGFVSKFSYLSRTVPDINQLLLPLEEIIKSNLIPALGMVGYLAIPQPPVPVGLTSPWSMCYLAQKGDSPRSGTMRSGI